MNFPTFYHYLVHLYVRYSYKKKKKLTLRARAINFYDVFGHVDKLIDQSLAVDLGEDSALVIVAQGPAHGLVVHVGFVFVEAPEPRDGLAVDKLEDTAFPIRPLDVARAVLAVLQQLEEEFPKICGRALAGLAFDGGATAGPAAGTRDREAVRRARLFGLQLFRALREAEFQEVEIIGYGGRGRLDDACRHAVGRSRARYT